MARGKTTVKAPALDNTLIRALVAELPAPAKDGFPNRESWFAMARNAFDVVYGETNTAQTSLAPNDPARIITRAVPVVNPAERLHVAPDGSVMCGARWIKFSEVAPGSVIHDERTAPDRGYDSAAEPMLGRTDNIIWADVGTRPDGTLPAGVRLVPAVAKDAA